MFHGSYLRISQRRRAPLEPRLWPQLCMQTQIHAELGDTCSLRSWPCPRWNTGVNWGSDIGLLSVSKIHTNVLFDSMQMPRCDPDERRRTNISSSSPASYLIFPSASFPSFTRPSICLASSAQAANSSTEQKKKGGREREKVWDEEQQFTSHPAA